MPSRAPGPVNDWDFVEFWIDPTASPPYALLLLGKDSGTCRVVDPSRDYKAVFTGGSYDEARLWLLEDEYERVEGRLLCSQV